MNRETIKREGTEWVKEGIISEEQLTRIMNRYERRDQSYLLVIFGVLLTSIGIFIFVFSGWSDVPQLSKVILMSLVMLTLFISGHSFFMKSRGQSKNDPYTPAHIYGISFIVLAYIFLGATLFLVIEMYDIELVNIWPLISWNLIGFLLFVFYKHPLFFVVGMFVNLYAQIYSELTFSSFSFVTFGILMTGYFYYTYIYDRPVYNHVFSIVLIIQGFIYALLHLHQYYWYMFIVLLVYALAEFIRKSHLRETLMYTCVVNVFLFKMYEVFFTQNSFFQENVTLQTSFFVALGTLMVIVAISKWMHNRTLEFVDFILFIPFFVFPFPYLWIILSMFGYSLYVLITGFQQQLDERIKLGTIIFILSTFTVYTEFAWEAFNKSLFFLIGGALLFLLSYILEKKRRNA